MSLVAVNKKRQKRIAPHMENLLILQINGSSQQSIRAVRQGEGDGLFFKKYILKKYHYINFNIFILKQYENIKK